MGLSPKRYAMARREQDFGRRLAGARSVTDAIYDAGYAASSAAYRDSHALGMPPAALRAGGANQSIRYATARTSLGPDPGGRDGPRHLHGGVRRRQARCCEELHARFPKATLEPRRWRSSMNG